MRVGRGSVPCAHVYAGRGRGNPIVLSPIGFEARRYPLVGSICWIALAEPRPAARSASLSPSTPPTTVSPRRRSGMSCRIAAATSGSRRPGASAAGTACRFTTLSIPEGLPSPNSPLTARGADGTLWIGTNSGLASYDGASGSFLRRQGRCSRRHGLVRRRATATACSGSARDRGLVSFDGRGIRTFGRADGLADDYVYSLHAGERRRALARIARPGGHPLHARARRRGSATAASSAAADGLGHNRCARSPRIPAGAIFFATRGGGLARFDGKRFTRLSAADGLPDDDLYALLVTRDGRELLVGSAAGVGICPLPGGASLSHAATEGNGLAGRRRP